MNDVLTTIVGYPGQRCDIRSVGNGLRRPATGINGSYAALELQLGSWFDPERHQPLLQGHHGWAFIENDFFVGMDSNHELFTQSSGL